MSNKFKRIIIPMIAVLFLMLNCGCGVPSVNRKPFEETEPVAFENTEIIENENYSLRWDQDYKRVLLFDKEHNISWSTTPAEAMKQRYDSDGIPLKNHPQLDSPILVDYLDPETQNLNTAVSYLESITEGNVLACKTENGLKVTYCFNELKISIPVEYILTEQGVDISVDTKEIREGSFPVCRVIVAPFMCSVQNTAQDSYLFVPSGSGALVYPKETGIMAGTYSQEVYGNDSARLQEGEIDAVTENEIRMPVYGAKNGNQALLAIIKTGAEAANIEVSCGATNIGFSGVFAAFNVRGFNWVESTYGYKRLYSDSLIQQRLTVGYSPLYGEEASYVGMANRYRDYLHDQYGISKSDNKKLLTLKIIGGVNVKNTFLGIPYDDFYKATTISEAEQIIRETYEGDSDSLAADLIGFGESGLDIGKIAGGYSFNPKLGKEKDISSLRDFCEKKKIGLYMNYDLIRFGKSSKNANGMFDKSINVNGQSNYGYYYSVWSRTRNLNFAKYYLIKRANIPIVAESLLKYIEKAKISGVGLDTLSNMCYSDYSEVGSFVKGNMAKDVSNILKSYKEKGYRLIVNDANDYSAVFATQIIDAPLQSSDFRIFDESVPFYEMVFNGYVPTSSIPVNLVANRDELVLKAMESGCGLTFTVLQRYDSKLMDSSQPIFYCSQYSDVKRMIQETIQEYQDIYAKVGNVPVKNHEILGKGIRKTTFANGYTVYVNYSNELYQTANVTVAPKGYMIEGGMRE